MYIADASLLKCPVAGIGHPGACRPVSAEAAVALDVEDHSDWEVTGAEPRTAHAQEPESQDATTHIERLTDGTDKVRVYFRNRRVRLRRQRIEQVDDGVPVRRVGRDGMEQLAVGFSPFRVSLGVGILVEQLADGGGI